MFFILLVLHFPAILERCHYSIAFHGPIHFHANPERLVITQQLSATPFILMQLEKDVIHNSHARRNICKQITFIHLFVFHSSCSSFSSNSRKMSLLNSFPRPYSFPCKSRKIGNYSTTFCDPIHSHAIRKRCHYSTAFHDPIYFHTIPESCHYSTDF